jgi:hypothetical protein
LDKQQVINYIIEQYKRGNSFEAISQDLIKLNYPQNIINESINEAYNYLKNFKTNTNIINQNNKPQKIANKVVIRFLLVFVIIFLLLILFFIFKKNDDSGIELDYNFFLYKKIINDDNNLFFYEKITTNNKKEVFVKINYFIRHSNSNSNNIIKEWSNSFYVNYEYSAESIVNLPDNLKKGDYFIVSNLEFLDNQISKSDNFFYSYENKSTSIDIKPEQNISNYINETIIDNNTNVALDCIGTDINCGGNCKNKCVTGQNCLLDEDCETFFCYDNICRVATCFDNIKNCHINQYGDIICEEDIDCGGPCDVDCINELEDKPDWIIDIEIKEKIKNFGKDEIEEALALCDKASTKKVKEECLLALATGKVKDYNICSKIDTAERKNMCFMDFVMNEKEYAVCDLIEDNYLKRSCDQIKIINNS